MEAWAKQEKLWGLQEPGYSLSTPVLPSICCAHPYWVPNQMLRVCKASGPVYTFVFLSWFPKLICVCLCVCMFVYVYLSAYVYIWMCLQCVCVSVCMDLLEVCNTLWNSASSWLFCKYLKEVWYCVNRYKFAPVLWVLAHSSCLSCVPVILGSVCVCVGVWNPAYYSQ